MGTTSPPAKDLPREAVLIVNVHSRRGEALFKDARTRLAEAGLRLLAAHAVRETERLQETVRDAVADGAPLVMVGGGDGSLSGTVDELVGKACGLGGFALGRAERFARPLA